MHQQPGDRSCLNEAIGGDHYGPVQVLVLDNMFENPEGHPLFYSRCTWLRSTTLLRLLDPTPVGSRSLRLAYLVATLTTGVPVRDLSS